jgi:phosphatidylserine/phosphatidylglycerophosphate/cardiolipin synthase-like enzyme
MSIDVTFLRDVEHSGPVGQPAAITSKLAAFIGAAQSSLHFAIYDFRLHEGGQPYNLVVNALKERAQAGIAVNIAFDAGKPNPEASGGDPAPGGTAAFLQHAFDGTPVRTRAVTDLNPIHGDPRLMHNKYVVRDGQTAAAAVWTGSLNFTDDAWTFMENNVVQIASHELACYYETDFEELWTTGNIDSTGANDRGTIQLEGASVDVAFSPGEGRTIDQEVAGLIASARKRIKIASMLISSHHVLYALRDAIQSDQVPEMSGLYDSTQMAQTIENWQQVPHNAPMIPMFQEVVANFASKASLPYSHSGKHNFMHNKLVVCDDSVFMGSFNLSHSATMNAENALVIHSAAVADQYSQYVDQLVAYYRGVQAA